MKVSFELVTLILQHCYSRDGALYYQRAIPADIRERYGSSKLIKVNLKTKDLKVAADAIARLNKQYEIEWELLRANPTSSPEAVRKHAEALLSKFGLQPAPFPNDQMAIDIFHGVLDDKREAYAGDDDETYESASGSEYLSPVEIKAAQLLAPKTEDTLSDALDLYLQWHEKRDDATFTAYTRRTFKTLIEALGDKPMSAFNRADARAYVAHQMKPKGSKSKAVRTATVRRRINTLKAVFGAYMREKELNRTNPFSSLSIPSEGHDTKDREPLTPAELAKVIDQCREKDDSIRWLVAMLADTGARLAEITGLALDDIHLTGPVPHIVIQPHPWRPLKTTGSARQVPLLGAALWAAKRVKKQAAKSDVYAFPRYVREDRKGPDSASATVNKWIRSLSVDHTAHELRHTMSDRLREVQCPEDVRFAIGGWTNASIGDGYGKGYSLKVKAEWLAKVTQDVA